MKALITGAAGFIGGHLAAELLARGYEVTGVDCFTDYYPRAMKDANVAVNAGKPGFHFIEDNLLTADLDGLLDDTTHVFHLAAQAGVRKSWGQDFRIYTSHNVDATQQLLEACVNRPIHRFVYASSSSLYGDNVSIPMREDALPQPVSPYGVTKLAAEQLGYLYHVNHGVPATALRYFTVYGPRQRPDMAFNRFIRAALDGTPITLYGDGEQTRDFTFVGDAVAANLLAADAERAPGEVVNVAGGRRVSLNELLREIGSLTGASAPARYQPARPGDVRDSLADLSRARDLLGYQPGVDLRSGLRRTIEHLAGVEES